MLDKRYDSGVLSLSPLFRGKPLSAAQCILPESEYSGPLLFAACSWSLTASYSTGPQIRNRCASRVQGLFNAVFSLSAAFLPSAPTLAPAPPGATAQYNPLSYQEGKRKSESCPLEMKN